MRYVQKRFLRPSSGDFQTWVLYSKYLRLPLYFFWDVTGNNLKTVIYIRISVNVRNTCGRCRRRTEFLVVSFDKVASVTISKIQGVLYS